MLHCWAEDKRTQRCRRLKPHSAIQRREEEGNSRGERRAEGGGEAAAPEPTNMTFHLWWKIWEKIAKPNKRIHWCPVHCWSGWAGRESKSTFLRAALAVLNAWQRHTRHIMYSLHFLPVCALWDAAQFIWVNQQCLINLIGLDPHNSSNHSKNSNKKKKKGKLCKILKCCHGQLTGHRILSKQLWITDG